MEIKNWISFRTGGQGIDSSGPLAGLLNNSAYLVLLCCKCVMTLHRHCFVWLVPQAEAL